jgi:hypothetical protein
MTAVRGYLAVLGTTALLTASVVVVALVGSGFAAFDASSDAGGASSPLERIRVEDDVAGAPGTGTEDAPSGAERRLRSMGRATRAAHPAAAHRAAAAGPALHLAPPARDTVGNGGHPLVGQLR